MLRKFKKIVSSLTHSSFVNYEYDDYTVLKNFLDAKMNTPLLGIFYRRQLLKHLGTILEYTNSTNMSWLENKKFVHQKDFMKFFIENMDCYRYKSNLICLSLHIFLPRENIFTQDYIDKFMSFNSEYYYDLYLELSGVNRTYLLGECMQRKIDISNFIFRIDEMDKSFIYHNIIDITAKSAYLYNIKKFVYEDKKSLDYVKKYMDNNPMNCIKAMLVERVPEKNIPDFEEITYLIVKDILVNENINFSDINYLTQGTTSTVFEIGTKVFKISSNKFVQSFPNNPYILKPLLRKKIEINGFTLYIEVQEKVDIEKKVTNDKIYELYKKLRNLNLVWNDVCPRNVGYLKEDNIPHWRFDLKPSDEVLGLDSYRGNEELKKGDLVIIDNDLIYDSSNAPTEMTYSKKYEIKFQYELYKFLKEIKEETDSIIFEKKCLENGFNPNFIAEILEKRENSKEYKILTSGIYK